MSDFASFYANNQPLSVDSIKKAKRVNFAGAVFLAASNGDAKSVAALVAAGVDVDEKWSCATALHIAAQKGHNDVVQTLLKNKAMVNATEKDGWTPLHLAAQNGHIDVVLTLLKNKAAINEKENDGWTPLHLAAQNGHIDVVLTLLKNKAAINEKENDGWTPLHLAAQNGHSEVVQSLLANKAAIDKKENDGLTALHLAAQNGHIDVVLTLLKNNAAIDKKGKDGWTPLHLAAHKGHNEVVHTLLKNKAVIDEKSNNGATALHLAAQYGHNEVVQTLLKNKAVIDEKSNNDATALHLAAQNGHSEVVQSLLANKAAIDKKENDGLTALHLAAQNGHIDVVLTLLKNNAAIDKKGKDGWTPLHLAAHKGHNEVVHTLLKNKAVIDEKRNNGATALHLAAQYGHNEVVQTLLKKKAAIDEKTERGNTALHLAAHNGHNEVVQTLLKKKAAVGAKNSAGSTPLQLAADKGHDEVVQKLAAAIDKNEKDGSTILPVATQDEAVQTIRRKKTAKKAAIDDIALPVRVASAAEAVGSAVRLESHELQISETTVGKGAFGVVYRGMWSDRAVAVKRLHPDNAISTDRPLAEIRREFLCEIELMATIAAHDNVVQLFGWAQLEGGAIGAVMELCEGGALVHTLYGGDERLRLAWSAAQRASVALDAARGLAHLHRQNIVHRDIAARNVMLTILGADRRVGKLGDFGRARRCEGESVDESDGANGFKWMAPEQMGEQRRHSTAASDVFSFGVLVYEIFACEAPWIGVHVLAVRRDVSEGKRETIPEGVPEAVARLIGNCWAHAPGDRPTMTECVEDIVSYRRCVAVALDWSSDQSLLNF